MTKLKILNYPRYVAYLLRTSFFVTKIIQPLNETKSDFLEIDITYNCDLKCINCNRSCRQAPNNEEMTVEQIKKFAKESISQKRKWRGIRIIGGEPTLHPDFFEILELIKGFKKYSPDIMLRVATNGFSKSSDKIISRIPDDFIIENTRKKYPLQVFTPFNFAPVDSESFRFVDYSNACPITSQCGLGFNRYGFYPCAVAGAIDRVFGFDIGRKSLPLPDDEMIEEKRILCKFCGHFREAFNPVKTDKEFFSKTWADSYKKYVMEKPKMSIY